MTTVIGTIIAATAATTEMTLATFDNTSSLVWQELNDPVMGGQSFGTWSVVDETGYFSGTVKNVSFLHAPGFCQVETASAFVANASAYINGGIALTVRTTTPSYRGFKFAFGARGAPRHHGGHEVMGSYKTGFKLDSTEWTTVQLPFTSFTSDWSDYTGDCTLDPDGYQHVCCDPDVTPQVCPDAQRLEQINGFSIWAEGAEGKYALYVASISAYADL